MVGTQIVIGDASDGDTIHSVKWRVFAANRELPILRQRIMYVAGVYGMDPIDDAVTLKGAGVPRDGSAKLDVLLVDLTEDEKHEEKEQLDRDAISAAQYGDIEELRDAIASGCDIDAVIGPRVLCENWVVQCTPLILAARGGHMDCMRLLLENNCNKEASDGRRRTALLMAAERGRADCVRLLVEGGANKDAKDDAGMTALIRAAKGGHTECVRLLVEGGADTAAVDYSGSSALAVALRCGHVAAARLLQG